MIKFTDFLGLITGRKTETSWTSPFFRLFVDRGPIKYMKIKRRPLISTNDLDVNRKLPEDYLERRKQREKERETEKGFGTPDVGIHDIWPT